MSNLHPTIAAALAPWTPRTPEEEARWVAADLARAVEEARPDAEQRRADRIERQERDTRSLMFAALVPGDRL